MVNLGSAAVGEVKTPFSALWTENQETWIMVLEIKFERD